MRPLQKKLVAFSLPLCTAILAINVLGQTTTSTAVTDDRVLKLETALTNAQMAGDNAWMLTCSALVLMMTGPGLALFYGGLVRKKNVLATMMQSFILMALVTVLWAIYGYSVAFSEGNAFFGNLNYIFLTGVGGAPNSNYAATIPQQTFMIYQLMFAIITPALITGAYAERIKFKAMLLFTILWATIVYFPLAHMVWGKGGFLNAVLGGRVPALDFAGGTVVHISSGFSALVCALYLGKRVGFDKNPIAPPHNLVLSVIGACMLWVGWFGFNAGSALQASSLSSGAFVATHFAAASATLGWMLGEWFRQGKPTVLGAISGAIAGLVGITPAAGFVTPMSALIIGFIAGLACFLMVTEVKKRLGYDDSLDAFGIHGAGGTVGAILTGVFATSAVNAIFKDTGGNSLPVGLIDGNSAQVVNQLIAIAITVGLSVVATFVILKFVDLAVGVRVSGDDELRGLDLSQHSEEAYSMEIDLHPVVNPAHDVAQHAIAGAAIAK
jgi:Amt family ammonium transporter